MESMFAAFGIMVCGFGVITLIISYVLLWGMVNTIDDNVKLIIAYINKIEKQTPSDAIKKESK